MNRYYIGHAIVAALGFLIGAMIATSISPGAILLLIGMGIVFGFSACVLFDQEFGSNWWPIGRPADGRMLTAKSSTSPPYRKA